MHLAPGEQNEYHVHRIPSVVVWGLSNATILSQEFQAAPAKPHAVAVGDTRYAAYDVTPLTHRVTNAGTTPFDVMDIELLQRPVPGGAAAPLLPSGNPASNCSLPNRWFGPIGSNSRKGERASIRRTRAAHLLIDCSCGHLETKGTHGPIRR